MKTHYFTYHYFTYTLPARRGKHRREGTIEIAIDMGRVAAHLAEKAFFSTGKKSRALNGAIVAKCHSLGPITDVYTKEIVK